MTYRIGIIGTGAGYVGDAEPPAPIAELAAAGFAPALIETRLRTFPMTPYDRGLTSLAYVDCAIEAEKSGFDAVFINTFGDYGIDEIRSATNMLVVGAGEATMAMCANVGRYFSIVSIWPPKLNFIYEERLRSTGMEGRCASVRNVLTDSEVEGLAGAGDTVSGLKDGRSDLKDRIVEEIEAAINEDGADTIALGCTCMAPVAPDIARRVSVPVLEPMRTGYKSLEALLSLQLKPSSIAFPKARPGNVAAVGALVSGLGTRDLGGDCEVCVIAKEAAE